MNDHYKNYERFALWMDARFRIPGTGIRFGLDALLGLIPGMGDFSSFLLSGWLVLALARRGAPGFLLAKMVLNIVIDWLIGSIPLVGDLFDVAFKANQRNVKLMREHYVEGKHNGSAAKLIAPLVLVLFVLMAGLLWLSFLVLRWFVHLFI